MNRGVYALIHIIKTIYNRISQHGEIRPLVENVTWLGFDRVVRLGINLFIVGWIARYLGRTQYGLLNYAMSLTVLIGALASFGTNNIIIREIVNHPEKKNEILGSSFFIRQFGGFLVVLISFIAVKIINSDDSLTQLLVMISAVTYLFASFDVIDLYFQSQIKSKYAVIANNAVFLMLSAVRILLIFMKAPLVAFAIAATVEVAVAQIGLAIMYRHTGHSIFKWKWNFAIAREIMRDSWPLMLSTVSMLLYLRIGQVMLGTMASYTELGDYSAAVKISEVWYFVPFVVSTTIYPKLIQFRKISKEVYYGRLQEFFTIMVLISYAAIIPTFFLNRIIIKIIFGPQYVNAGIILSIHIWAGLFVAMGTARSSWCNIENYTRGTFYATLTGAVLNVALNIPLIRMYGGIGAAAATMIARIAAGYIATFFISREIFMMQTKSLFLDGLFRMIKHDLLGMK
ncbi:MAG: hypothetical protein A2176_05060 [Spirochaetes bacterium RBG_13_51_14]|nr:MAG: hypothetical protein A2176_05060 [Spirochaetes bacterium RBG_13_51_14]